MSGWAVLIFLGGFASWMVGLFLALYLDLRLHALKQSGDLPRAPRLYGFGLSGIGIGLTLDFRRLYSREFREIDGHTRRLVPIIRIALPLGLMLAIGSVALSLLT
ncbi:hypothetical protein ACETK8_02655 [Brevundimonas staleyi]|uniref:Uncharacterized protein n=1 Tax=Brevundimonas staleyi TaxID=74326 RepID=A0ABW0FX55_9CAUL